MNNLHQQKFQFFRFTETEPNNDIYGFDVWDQEKIFLHLKVGEVYSQYLDLSLEESEFLQELEIWDISGNKLNPNTQYFYTIKNVNSKNILIFAFKPLFNQNKNCFTFFLKLKTSLRDIYSNYFNLIKDNEKLRQTTLVTYWHDENFYNANYFDSEFIPQQIRLPLYFSHNFNEADAEEYQDSYRNENTYRSGKVKRLFMESWKTILNDSNYTALCTALDSDHIYFDNVYFSLKPFNPERDKDEKGFTLSTIECQRFPGKTFDQGEFDELFDIYSDDIEYYFTYSHEPEDIPNAGQLFLVNRLFINYVNDYGILYNCDLKVQISAIPIKGFLANNITHEIYEVNSIISYCDKDNLVYFPNGFDNDLGISGNYVDNFKYRIIDQNSNSGKEMTQTINMTDLSSPEIDLSVSILWYDNTSSPKTGNAIDIGVKLNSIVFDPTDPVVNSVWEIFDGANWIFYKTKTTDSETITLGYLSNKIRLRIETTFSDVAYSNILEYEKNSTPNIYITDVNSDISAGYCTYKLHVDNESFTGFVNITGRRNPQARNVRITSNHGIPLIIPNGYPGNPFVDFFNSTPITVPAGVYDCFLQLSGVPVSTNSTVQVDAGISYGFDTNYYNGITYAEAHLEIDPIGPIE